MSFIFGNTLPSLRSRLAILMLACALPTIVAFAALTYHFVERERQQVIADAQQVTRALMLAVDRELENGETAARALLASPSLARGDLAAFQAQASSMLRPGFSVDAFVLNDTNGVQLLNTAVPYGRALPSNDDAAQIRAVAASARPATFALPPHARGAAAVWLHVPVWRDGKVAYVLALRFRPERLGAPLVEQRLAAGQFAELIDASQIIVARTAHPERYVGQPVAADLQARRRGRSEGLVDRVSREGVALHTVFRTSAASGWTVAIGFPRESIVQGLAASITAVGAALALLLALGFAMAWRLGGVIGAAVRALTGPANALGHGAPLEIPPLSFREADTLAAALLGADAELRRYRAGVESLVAGRTRALDASNAVLSTVYSTAPVGLAFVDPQLRFVMVNDFLAALNGKPVAEHIGHTLPEVIGPAGVELEAGYREVLRTGAPLLGVESSGVLMSDPPRQRHFLASYHPITGSDGTLTGINAVVLDITEDRALRMRLRDSEAHFRALYEMSADAHMLTTAGAGFISANRATAALFGCDSVEQFLTLSPATASPEFQPDGRRSDEAAQERMRRAIEEGRHGFEWLHQRRDGTVFHADVLLSSIDVGGKGVIHATVRDISERKRTEVALRDSKRLLHSIVENIPAMTFMKDAVELRFEMFNRAGEQLLGYPREALLGKSDHDLFPFDQAGHLIAADRAVLASDQVSETPYEQVRTAGGDTRYLTTRKVALRDERGGVTHLLGVSIDITDRVLAEQALRATSERLEQSERFVRTITDEVPGMVSYWDADLRCRFANRLHLEWFGHSPKRMLGRTMGETLGPELMALIAPQVSAALSGKAQTFARERTRVSGESSFLWANLIPDFDEAGKVRGLYALLTDITALKRSERQLQELNEQLTIARDRAEAASSAKSEFVANMSHEIRTPMNAIIGLARLLEAAPLAPRERGQVAKIKLATHSLLAVLNDVLDFSRIEAGHLPLETTAFTIEQVLSGVAVLLSANAWSKGVEPVFAVAPEVPASLMGDPMRLQQVLLNLVGNAIKFTARGEVVLSIEQVGAGTHGVTLAFSVRDTGIGIAPDQQERMFDAFAQGDSSISRKYGGTGLGLAISRRLVGLMGGEIGVSSVLGEGSTFRCVIPFGLAPADAAPAPQPAPGGAQMHVLVADDNATVRAAIAATCAAHGWSVTTAAGGKEALAQLRGSLRFDLAIIDCAMPDLDGLSLLAAARADPWLVPPPVIMLVPDDAIDNLGSAFDAAQVDAVLGKPLAPRALLGAIADIRSGHPQRRALATPAPLAGLLRGMRVLLVEDNEINQDVANIILQHAGASVEIAANGRIAVAILADAPTAYDAVLMDIQMPVMDGYQASMAIRRMGLTELPIVAMTANVLHEDRQRAIDAGMNAHVAKPIDVEQLCATLAAVRAPSPDAAPGAVDGIDLKAVLPRFGGNFARFAATLKRFAGSHDSVSGEIRQHLEAGDRAAAGQLLHRLRGVAANLGATETARVAGEIEDALRSSPDAAMAPAVARLDAALARVIAAARALPEASAPAPAASGRAVTLAQLHELLQNNDLKALADFGALRAAILAALAPDDGRALEQAIAVLDFATAAQLLEPIINRKDRA